MVLLMYYVFLKKLLMQLYCYFFVCIVINFYGCIDWI